jgi:hypothetical protein
MLLARSVRRAAVHRWCDSGNGINQARHSRRIVATTGSQIALAFGLRAAEASSKAAAIGLYDGLTRHPSPAGRWGGIALTISSTPAQRGPVSNERVARFQ